MEAALLTLNGIAFVLMVYMGLHDERRANGTPQTSLFRMTEVGALRPRERAEQERRQRISRSSI